MEVRIINKETQNEAKNYKMIVDVKNPDKIFSVVSNDYKIVQHADVVKIISEAITDLGFEFKIKNTEMGAKGKEGGRLRSELKFPQVTSSIAGEKIQLWASLDNS